MKSNILTNWFYTTNQILPKDSDLKPTHLLLDGGRVRIEDTLIDTFYKLYSQCIDQGIPIHVVEHRTKIFKMFSDLDFINETEMSHDKIEEIIKIIQEAVYFMYQSDNYVIICTTDIKKVIKESNEYIKQGIHLYWPNIIVNNENALLCRNLIIHKLKTTLGERESYNLWDDVVDLTVYTTNGIRMVGSSKCSYDRRDGKTEFIDDKRVYKPVLILDSFGNRLDDKLKNWKTYDMIVETSVRTQNTNITEIKQFPEHLKNIDYNECEECDTITSKRLNINSINYQEIVRFFKIRVKDYSSDDIKKILNFDDKVYIILTKSRYCQNIERAHNSCQIYFKLSKDGLCQKCHCTCNTMIGRKYGYCKDYSSDFIQCTDHLLKLLKWNSNKSKESKSLPNIEQQQLLKPTVDNFRDKLYNKFTNKSPPKQRKRNTK